MHLRTLTPAEKRDFDRMVSGSEQLCLDFGLLTAKGKNYGYLAAPDGSPDADREAKELAAAGAAVIYHRNEKDIGQLVAEMGPQDALVVCRLQALSRSPEECARIVRRLADKGCTLCVADLGWISRDVPASLVARILESFSGEPD